MRTDTFERLQTIQREKGAGFVLLLDPDKLALEQVEEAVSEMKAQGVDVLFIGGSLMLQENFDEFVARVKQASDGMPVVIFPGSLRQISAHADAILYLSLISGRNPTHLIDTQVQAAPIIWRLGIEPISCAYMLIESGGITSAEFMSNTKPIPRDKPDLALAHALAAEFLGFKMIYLEAGSGARLTVPEEMIQAVSQVVSIPVIVGGGIRTPEEAARKVDAGARFVVVGNFFETQGNLNYLQEFARAIHQM